MASTIDHQNLGESLEWDVHVECAPKPKKQSKGIRGEHNQQLGMCLPLYVEAKVFYPLEASAWRSIWHVTLLHLACFKASTQSGILPWSKSKARPEKSWGIKLPEPRQHGSCHVYRPPGGRHRTVRFGHDHLTLLDTQLGARPL